MLIPCRHPIRPETMRLALLTPLLCLLLELAGCGDASGASRPLRFTAIPDQDRAELEQRFRPLADHLSERLGVPVEYVATSDYSASVEMFKAGDVELAWFGGLTGVQARAAVPGARAIAQGAIDPHFRSYFIAHDPDWLTEDPDGPLPLTRLRGARFAFGSRQSTSGRLMPEHFLREASGVAPEQLFSEVVFSGSHDRTAELVSRGAVDAGVLNFRTYEQLVREGGLDPEACVVLWRSPEYADYNWTVHPGADAAFGAGTAEALRRALLELEDPELLAALQRPEGLIPAEDAEFEGIADVARALGFLRD
jgi:phosphonate transport system substrate-binding protein